MLSGLNHAATANKRAEKETKWKISFYQKQDETSLFLSARAESEGIGDTNTSLTGEGLG